MPAYGRNGYRTELYSPTFIRSIPPLGVIVRRNGDAYVAPAFGGGAEVGAGFQSAEVTDQGGATGRGR